jgi:hypothetical protein
MLSWSHYVTALLAAYFIDRDADRAGAGGASLDQLVSRHELAALRDELQARLRGRVS